MAAGTADATARAWWSEEPAARPDRARIRARIGGLHCSLCTGTIEKALGRLPGVEKVAVSLTHEQALVEFDPTRIRPEQLLQALRDLGYTIHDPRKLRPFEEEERELVREGRRFLVAVAFSLAAIALVADPEGIWSALLAAGATIALVGFVHLVLRGQAPRLAVVLPPVLGLLAGLLLRYREELGLAPAVPWLTGALAVGLVFGVARHILHMAVQALRRGILNQHVLLESGAFAGLTGGAIGLLFEPPGYPTASFFAVAVMVGTYHLFSEWLSLIVKTRSSQAVKRLLDLQPDLARVVRDGRESEVPLAEVRPGDLVRIRPGERVPVDGEVVEGRSAVDLSLVTGEPIPVERGPGDRVIGGSINGTGALLVRVTAVGEESFLQRVAREVEDARALKPGLLHLVDRVLLVYTPTVLGVALLAAVGWIVVPWLLGSEPDPGRAVFAGLGVLVMGYPCAVGISAPLSIVRGAGEAAERGILMRTGEAFQGYRLVRRIAFDKTGTLTIGKPRLVEIEPFGTTAEELLALAAAVEASSEHPLADAVVEAAFARGLDLPEARSFEAVPGKGVRALVDGETVRAGTPSFLAGEGIGVASAEARIRLLEESGRTVIAVAHGTRLLGLLAFGDEPRPEAAATIAALRREGVRTVLITGDNEANARRIAGRLGIDEVHARVLPGEKAELIRRLQRSGRVAMVGDGINDAPALMQADVGIAMGAGTDIAIDSADIVILNNRLDGVVVAREISRRSYRKMVQNVSLAFMFNGIGVPLAATGLLHPVWAMVAMVVSVTTIFLNSLWGRPRLFVDAIATVGRPPAPAPAQA